MTLGHLNSTGTQPCVEVGQDVDGISAADGGCAGGFSRRAGHRSSRHHGRAGMAEAGQVCRFDGHLHVHARMGLHLPERVAATAQARGARHCRASSSSRSRSSRCRRGAARRATSTSRRRSMARCSSIMGSAIVLQTLLSVLVAVALWRQQFQDRALGWALRLGMVITIAGASTGGLMTRPTDAQLEQIVATHQAYDHRCAHCRGARWRTRSAGHRLERRARRSSRAALHRTARAPGAAGDRLVAVAASHRGSTPRTPDGRRRRQLRDALPHPDLAGTARAGSRQSRRAHRVTALWSGRRSPPEWRCGPFAREPRDRMAMPR